MLRETFGEDIFARSIAEEIEDDPSDAYRDRRGASELRT
jgi:hypothetical protein